MYSATFKKLIDCSLSIIGILLLLPLLIMVGIAIKLTSKGPILYQQKRYGKNFIPFQLLKFRSMIINADQKGLLITTQNDHRITSIGKLLRMTKFDELPQLINVIKGDMALVGPRPEVKKYIDLFKTDYKKILTVRPGITDNAAIAFINEEMILASKTDPETEYIKTILPKKIKHYHEYIQIISLKTDITIIIKTLLKMITKKTSL